MSSYHRVLPGVWDQPWTDDARHLALYLMTCRHRLPEGLYRLPTAYIVEDVRWTANRIETALTELEADGFVERDQQAKIVLLPGALKIQVPANDNGVLSAVRKLEQLPRTPLLARLLELADDHCPRLAQGIRDHLEHRLVSTSEEPSPSTPAPKAPKKTALNGTAVKYNGKPVPEGRLATATAILEDFAAQTGRAATAYKGDGRPTDSLTRVIGALTDWPDRLTADYGHQLIEATLKSEWWGTGPATVGVVFGPKVIEQNMARVDHAANGNGHRRSTADKLGITQ